MTWLDGITKSIDMRLSKFREIVKDKETWNASVHAVAKRWTQPTDWVTTMIGYIQLYRLIFVMFKL